MTILLGGPDPAHISYFDISRGSHLLISILTNFLIRNCIFEWGKSLHGLALMFTSFISFVDYFQNYFFSFRNPTRVSTGLYPDQAPHNVVLKIVSEYDQ